MLIIPHLETYYCQIFTLQREQCPHQTCNARNGLPLLELLTSEVPLTPKHYKILTVFLLALQNFDIKCHHTRVVEYENFSE